MASSTKLPSWSFQFCSAQGAFCLLPPAGNRSLFSCRQRHTGLASCKVRIAYSQTSDECLFRDAVCSTLGTTPACHVDCQPDRSSYSRDGVSGP